MPPQARRRRLSGSHVGQDGILARGRREKLSTAFLRATVLQARMHCWFCASPLSSGSGGPHCPFAPCPACKAEAGIAPLDGPDPERWRRMRQVGRLTINIQEAGFSSA
jgi:hypothetical protein